MIYILNGCNWLENIFDGKCNNALKAKRWKKNVLEVLHFAIGVYKKKWLLGV